MRCALLASFTLVSSLGAHAADPAPLPPANLPLAVLPLGGGASEAARAPVDERIRLAAGRYATVQERNATRQALQSAITLGLACDASAPPCAQQMGGLAGAARVLHGSLDEEGYLSLRLTTVSDAAVSAPQMATLPAAGVARDAAIERLVLALLAPERISARLQLEVGPRGARVVVDDIFRGPAPLPTALVLAPGAHEVFVTHPGYLSESRSVSLEVGAHDRLMIELERDPDAPVAQHLEADDEPVSDSADDGARAPETVAVFPLAGGLSPRVRAALDEALAAELSRRHGLAVIGPREVERTLATAPPDCGGRERCLADVARVLGADAFVVSRAEVKGGLTTLTARRHQTETGDALTNGSLTSLSDNRRRLLFGTPELAAQLFPDREVEPGTAPVDLDFFADRTAGGPLRPWVFWTAAGVGATLALATTAFGVVALTAEEPVDAGRAGAAFAIGAGGTVVALGAAGVLGLLVDWEGR